MAPHTCTSSFIRNWGALWQASHIWYEGRATRMGEGKGYVWGP